MVVYILIALIVVPLVEIAVFIEVGGALGLWPTLGIVVLTAFVGTALLRQQGLQTLNRARASLARNETPVAEVFDGVCLLLAGALLLTPGFVTDALGGLLFLPPVRAWLRYLVLRRLFASGEVWIDGERVDRRADARPDERGAPVIEGDYAEVGDEGGGDDGAPHGPDGGRGSGP